MPGAAEAAVASAGLLPRKQGRFTIGSSAGPWAAPRLARRLHAPAMTTIAAIAEAIEATPIGTAIAESRYAFPIIEGTHLITLSLSVGLIFLTDLRLMGLFLREIPAADVIRHLRPYVLSGFALVFLSGGLLFWAEAASVIASPAWVFKFAFIFLAGLNALYFEFVIARRPGVLDETQSRLPRSVKYAGLASLTIWTLVIICGRLIAYIPRWS
jgi:inner membrane protein involved in colicin E2 resistance